MATLPAPIRSGNPDAGEGLLLELFRLYVHKEPISEVEEKLGIRTDSRSFHNWLPAFTWNDIPVLLELAENEQLMNGMPRLVISSYIGGRCRRGMIALWFVYSNIDLLFLA